MRTKGVARGTRWVARHAFGRWAGVRIRTQHGVALTFDDGPDPRWTPQVLDVLAGTGAHATFFLCGDSAARHRSVVERMVAEGHAVGSHTRSHPDLGTLDLREVRQQVGDGHAMVVDAAGRDDRLFRPGKGHLDWRVATAVRDNQVTPWLWSASSEDWRVDATVESIVSCAGGLVDGDVVLFHDAIQPFVSAASDDRSRTIAALPRVIGDIRETGLRFVTLAGEPPGRLVG